MALTTFSDLVQEARERVKRDALAAGLPDDGKPLDATVAPAPRLMPMRWRCILALAWTSLLTINHRSASWRADRGERCADTFRTAGNPDGLGLCRSEPVFRRRLVTCERLSERHVAKCSSTSGRSPSGQRSCSSMRCSSDDQSRGKVVSTDPPYYDNIGYADLSDFFYVWLRRSLKPVFPDLFATLAVPKG